MKKIKQIILGCFAVVMMMSSAVVSVGAEGDIPNAEVEFSIMFLNTLPIDKDKLSGFKETLDHHESNAYELDSYNLDSEREDVIIYKYKSFEKIKMNEKEVYNELFGLVQSLIEKVEARTLGSVVSRHGGPISKHSDMPKNWRIAKAIYRWVVNNIMYDHESLDKDIDGRQIFKKPQDALFVYNQKMGVCLGKANLMNLMMRMANIPCLVVGTPTHTYNAIFLDSDNADRKGWTLIDSTWASPSFGNEMEEYGNLIAGGSLPYRGWVKDIFNKDDEYAKIIEEMTTSLENVEINKKTIQELNAKIKIDLKELNKRNNSDFKFEDIKFVVKNDCWLGDCLNIEYKTNLNDVEAKKIMQELKQRNIFEKTINQTVCLEEDGKLDEFFNYWYEEINKQNNDDIMDRVKEYVKKLNDICIEVLGSIKNDELEKNINKINEDINLKIEELNAKFDDIIIIKSVKFKLMDNIGNKIWADLKANLNYDDFKKMVDKKERYYRKLNIEKFFPVFYNNKLSFKDANTMIIQMSAHTIVDFSDGDISNLHNRQFDWNRLYFFTIDGVQYILRKSEGKAYIEVSSDSRKKAQENVELSSYIVKLGIPLKIRYNIKSLKLKEGQTVDISGATSLEYVDTTESDKYDGYDRNNRELVNKVRFLDEKEKATQHGNLSGKLSGDMVCIN